MSRTVVASVLAVLALASPAFAAPPAGAILSARPFNLTTAVAEGEAFMGLRLLGTLELVSPPGHADRIHSLSALGWDDDEGLLYAQSDRGELFHLEPAFEAGRLTGVTLRARYFLRGEDGQQLGRRSADAEGLDVRRGRNGVRGDTHVVIAFERRPRVGEFTPDGRFVGRHALPAPFEDHRTYSDANSALEAVAWDPVHGAVTGPERSLAGGPYGVVPLVARAGVLALYPLEPTTNSSLVALERLPDGRLLALERGYGLLKLPIVISLKLVHPLPARPGDATIGTALVAVLHSSRGWSVDNFEGLARHRGNRFFMVSDDNDRPYQRTLLTYFEVLGEAPPGAPAGIATPPAEAR